MTTKPILGFIGAGKVGNVLARLWGQAGYQVSAIYNRTGGNAESLARQVGADVVYQPGGVVDTADLIFLTVTDDAIGQMASEIGDRDWHNKAIVHTSGVTDLEPLKLLAEQGAMVGSIHPVFPFADIEAAITGLPGNIFAIETSHEPLLIWLRELVAVLHGQEIIIPVGMKASYHAALTIVSNYTVTLYAAAERLLRKLGAEQDVTRLALIGLLQATVDNIRQQGTPDALTGPLVRADTGTVRAHLQALRHEHALHASYKALARLTFPLLEERDMSATMIEELLREDDNASDPA